MSISWEFIPQRGVFDDDWYLAYPSPHANELDPTDIMSVNYDMLSGDEDNFYMISPRNYPYISSWGSCLFYFYCYNQLLESGVAAKAEILRCSSLGSIIENSGLTDFQVLGSNQWCQWSGSYSFSSGSITDRVALHLQMKNTSGSTKHYYWSTGYSSPSYYARFGIEFPSSVTSKKRMGIRLT